MQLDLIDHKVKVSNVEDFIAVMQKAAIRSYKEYILLSLTYHPKELPKIKQFLAKYAHFSMFESASQLRICFLVKNIKVCTLLEHLNKQIKSLALGTFSNREVFNPSKLVLYTDNSMQDYLTLEDLEPFSSSYISYNKDLKLQSLKYLQQQGFKILSNVNNPIVFLEKDQDRNFKLFSEMPLQLFHYNQYQTLDIFDKKELKKFEIAKPISSLYRSNLKKEYFHCASDEFFSKKHLACWHKFRNLELKTLIIDANNLNLEQFFLDCKNAFRDYYLIENVFDIEETPANLIIIKDFEILQQQITNYENHPLMHKKINILRKLMQKSCIIFSNMEISGDFFDDAVYAINSFKSDTIVNFYQNKPRFVSALLVENANIITLGCDSKEVSFFKSILEENYQVFYIDNDDLETINLVLADFDTYKGKKCLIYSQPVEVNTFVDACYTFQNVNCAQNASTLHIYLDNIKQKAGIYRKQIQTDFYQQNFLVDVDNDKLSQVGIFYSLIRRNVNIFNLNLRNFYYFTLSKHYKVVNLIGKDDNKSLNIKNIKVENIKKLANFGRFSCLITIKDNDLDNFIYFYKLIKCYYQPTSDLNLLKDFAILVNLLNLPEPFNKDNLIEKLENFSTKELKLANKAKFGLRGYKKFYFNREFINNLKTLLYVNL